MTRAEWQYVNVNDGWYFSADFFWVDEFSHCLEGPP